MNKQSFVSAILLSLCLLSCTAEFTHSDIDLVQEITVQETVIHHSVLVYPSFGGKEDPNSDASWTWMDKESVKIFYTSSSDVGIDREVSLPWYTQGNPLNVINKDIDPETGWAYAFKDFGTLERRPNMPVLSLYNKNTNLLRIFVYNSQRIGASYFKGELVIRDRNDADRELFKGEGKAVANTYDSWINLEYEIADFATPLDIEKFLIEVNLTGLLETIIH